MGSRPTRVSVPTRNRSSLWGVRATLAVCILFAAWAEAQDQHQREDAAATAAPQRSQHEANLSASGPADSETRAVPEQKKTTDRRGSFIIAPLPISSPALGTGIVPVLGYIFPFHKNDNVSPPSVVGMAALMTDNGSRAFTTYADLFIKQDSYRITALYFQGNINYDLYGTGVVAGDAGHKLPLEQSGHVFRAEALRRLGLDFFLGVRFWTGSSKIVLRAGTDIPPGTQPPPDIGLHTTLRAMGLRLNRDTRPNRFYPATGTLLEFTSDFFSEGLGSKYTFQTYRFTFNKYGSLGKSHVLAYNLFVCGTGGGPPFYGNCVYGTNNELRGYTAGQYLDRYMIATQLEYRLTLPKRFGVVAFGGIGEVVPDGAQLLKARYFLPGGGAGARFQLSTKYHVNLRADIALGKDTWTWSMGVGEAF